MWGGQAFTLIVQLQPSLLGTNPACGTAFSQRVCLAVSSISPSFNWPHFSPLIFFDPLKRLNDHLGRCPFPRRAGRQGPHRPPMAPLLHAAMGRAHRWLCPLSVKRPSLLLTAVLGLLCTKFCACIGGQQVSAVKQPALSSLSTTRVLQSTAVLHRYIRSPQSCFLARVTPMPEVQRRFARPRHANSL